MKGGLSTAIAQLPKGLLALFDIKSAGDYPSQLTDNIQLTYDVGDLQIQGINAERVTDNLALAAGAGTQSPGTFNLGTQLIVPSNEVWLVSFAQCVTGVVGVAASVRPLMIGYAPPGVTGLNGFRSLVDPPVATLTGTAVVQYGITVNQGLTHPHVVGPGSEFLVFADREVVSVVGGAVNVISQLRYLRCRV